MAVCAKVDTKPEQVKDYMINKFPKYKNDFKVEAVKIVNKDIQTNTASFKVGINYDLLPEISKPEFWPKNIIVRRYNFKTRKTSNFSKVSAERNKNQIELMNID